MTTDEILPATKTLLWKTGAGSDEDKGSAQVGRQSDSLSVFSSFDANTKVQASESGVALGKIFATGVAAQRLSSGVALNLQLQGVGKVQSEGLYAADILAAQTECIKALVALKKEGVDNSRLPSCETPEANVRRRVRSSPDGPATSGPPVTPPIAEPAREAAPPNG
jgi:hypothetical protein